MVFGGLGWFFGCFHLRFGWFMTLSKISEYFLVGGGEGRGGNVGGGSVGGGGGR